MGRRVAHLLLGMGLSVTVACSFGVDLDGIFGGSRDGGAADGSSGDAAVDATGDVVGPPAVEALQVTSGERFSCALRVDGTVTCWGWNDAGQLGDLTTLPSSTPVLVRGLNDATQIAAGGRHACAVRKGGTAVCWGANGSGQLGSTAKGGGAPVSVTDLTDVAEVSATAASSCARRTDGSVWCWGDDTRGQLGDGPEGDGTWRATAKPTTAFGEAVELASGREQACVRLKTGEVYCWGANTFGQVGAGVATGGWLPSPTRVVHPTDNAPFTGVTSIGSGPTSEHTCAVAGGLVYCWGKNLYGSLGNGNDLSSSKPVRVLDVVDAVATTTGAQFSCATGKFGVSCWGDNLYRQTGTGDSAPSRSTPIASPVLGMAQAPSLAAGSTHMCAVQAGGKISCWGADIDGRLGRGTRIYAASPVQVAKLTGVSQMALGSEHACAIASDGVSCWGDNAGGQLGSPASAVSATASPVTLPATGALRVGAGLTHACAVSSAPDGKVYCWGAGYDGNYVGNFSPTVFALPGPASDVAGGLYFTCALLATGEVASAGNNNNSRLGRGGVPQVPARVVGTATTGAPYLTNVKKISVRGGHSCVLTNAGGVQCWGSNYGGECGLSIATGSVAAPTVVQNLAAATDIACGVDDSCAIMGDGSVQCWGYNDRGQLGRPSPSQTSTPISVDLGGKKATALALGDKHSCALTTEGTVMCWGDTRYGQLGTGVRDSSSRPPAAVPGLSGITTIAAGDNSTCAVGAGGVAWCWGLNASGQLGEGSTFVSGTPGRVVGY